MKQNRNQSRGQESDRPAAAPGHKFRAIRRAACSSLSLFCTSRRDTAVLSASCRACSEIRICVRASAGLAIPAPARRSDPRHPRTARPDSPDIALFGSAIAPAQPAVSRRKRVVEIGAHALELRRPRGQRIGLIVVQHVAHGQRRASSNRSGCAAAAGSLSGCDPPDCSAIRASRRSAA